MIAEKIDIPKELEILNPESQKRPIVVGRDAYLLYPLTEGQAERVSQLISGIITDIVRQDAECPACHNVYEGALGKKVFCSKCKGKQRLVSLQKTPYEALTYEDRIPKLLEELIGISASTAKESLTIPQFKHIAAVLYGQNFKDDGAIPEESRKNFQSLLEWLGLGADSSPTQNQLQSASEKFTKASPTSTDSPESTSGENGESEETANAD